MDTMIERSTKATASMVVAGLKAALMLAELGPKLGGTPLPAERLFDAINVILSYQNHDGGWATYENTRSFHALEVGVPHLQTSSAGSTVLPTSCHPAGLREVAFQTQRDAWLKASMQIWSAASGRH
jgi:hypothetical protein